MADMKASFHAFCDTVKKGSSTATDKTLKKMCTDCKIYGKGLDANRVDIQFRKHVGNAKREVDYNDFVRFVEGPLAEAYMESSKKSYEDAVADLKTKIANGNPQSHGATKGSADAATARLTDTKGYTGAHKQRFDESGKGKGIEGRENVIDEKAAQGYVGGYKGMNTYDKK